MAKIVINATGFGGNFYPFLTLAKALKKRGHAIKFATGSHFYKDSIEKEGLEYYPLSEFLLPAELESNPKLKQKVIQPKNNIHLLLKYRVLPNLRNSYEELDAISENADLIISGVLPFTASLVHEKRGIKWISMCIHPALFFSNYEIWPPHRWMIEVPEQLRIQFIKACYSVQRFRVESWTKEWRLLRKDLGLTPNRNILFDSCHSPSLQLAAFSQFIWPSQPDWPAHRHPVGFIRSPYVDTPLSPELEKFLDSNEKPYVFTMSGSSSRFFGEQFFDMCLKVIQEKGMRAVLSCGDMEDYQIQVLRRKAGKLPSVIVTGPEPFSKLFMHAKAVVHHGGIGTIGESLLAGVPMVIFPVDAEHPLNAFRISQLECGIWSNAQQVSTRDLEKLLLEISKPKYKNAALTISERMKAENGLETSISFIESALKK